MSGQEGAALYFAPFSVWQAARCTPRVRMVASLPSLGWGLAGGCGSRLVHAVCMVLYTGGDVHTYRTRMITYAGGTCLLSLITNVYAARTT